MRKKKKYTSKELLSLPYSELRSYLDSMKVEQKPAPVINYKEMGYLEALCGNFLICRQMTHRGGMGRLLNGISKKRTETEEFHFFWSSDSPFSQWYKVDFKGPVFFVSYPLWFWQKENKGSEIISYSSAEQYMMFHKAVMFYDEEIAHKILETKNVRKIKELGRQVKNFDPEIWDAFKKRVVYNATYCKFKQNPVLLDQLLATYPKTLVEASPNDNIWGIGLSADDERAQLRTSWKGNNLLGEILTEFRNFYIERKGDINEYPR